MWHVFSRYYLGMTLAWWFFFIIIVIAILWASGSFGAGAGIKKDSQMEALKKRFANGEISKEEYEKSKKALTV